ncbi:MAG: hypothetical protein KAG28_06470 [Cocleimonas sp.]|nr:hypothetical protein [Cocleimonas sp.]
MSDLQKTSTETPALPAELSPKSFLTNLRETLLSDPLSNLPSILFLGVAVFGLITLISTFAVDFLVFPFLLIAIFSSVFATWHIRLLGSLKQQVESLGEENDKLAEENQHFTDNNKTLANKVEQFTEENNRLAENRVEMEQTIDQLKINNDHLHNELAALTTLRTNLQQYADQSKVDFTEILGEVNQSFQRLEALTIENERALLHRIAQDLEFLDHEPMMTKDEYQRFIERVPLNLLEIFEKNNFESISGTDQRIDHIELKTLVQSVMETKAKQLS